MKYLINSTNVYRVPTVADALRLRETLSKAQNGELVSFSYVTKQIKVKNEVVEEYQQVKVKLAFQSEKEPENSMLDAYYSVPEMACDG